MIQFGVFTGRDKALKKKKMCVDANTVYKPDSGYFIIISASD